MKHEIDVEETKQRYQAELNQFIAQLNQLDQQRAVLIQAIQERRGILAFLESLNTHKESDEKATA